MLFFDAPGADDYTVAMTLRGDGYSMEVYRGDLGSPGECRTEGGTALGVHEYTFFDKSTPDDLETDYTADYWVKVTHDGSSCDSYSLELFYNE